MNERIPNGSYDAAWFHCFIAIRHGNNEAMKHRIVCRYMFLFFFLLFAENTWGQLPDNFHDEIFSNGFDFPTGVTFDANGRGYVWEKAGKVRMFDENGEILPEPLLDIREEVADWKDHGLMGFCLDNDFLENGYFYLLYAVDPHYDKYFGTPQYHPDSSELYRPTIGRVCRYTADAASDFTRVISGSRHILLGETMENGIPLLYVYHGLGSLIMGNDGTLLISCGDATSNIGTDVGSDSLETPVSAAIAAGILTLDQDVGSYRAQYLGNYNGKVLRIDASTGDGPPSNPFFDPDAPRSAQSRIWAYGFRNPYRIALRPGTGSHYAADGQPGVIYVGDVGNAGWEEVDIVKKGGQNFGWPITEGLEINGAFAHAYCPRNQLAPNELYSTFGCGHAYFDFREVFARPDRNRLFIPNPCDPGSPLPDAVFPSVESPPAITWNNQKWNAERKAAVPAFDEDGLFAFVELDDPDCPVSSELFSGFSSLGGAFYESGPFPETYQGKYFAMDFSGWIRVFDFDEQQRLQSVTPFHDGAENIVHLERNDLDGSLYYLNLNGEVHRISYGGNPAPVAVIEADRYYGASPLTVRFDGTSSTDESGPIATYFWEFGDGATSTEAQPEH
ncbi:MAG: PQQ-dependent sugar dehydrogenase, partial [Lewinella sp.]|nr:PQQ-dependent sugar dehydrogenase [Lewinella sp.]